MSIRLNTEEEKRPIPLCQPEINRYLLLLWHCYMYNMYWNTSNVSILGVLRQSVWFCGTLRLILVTWRLTGNLKSSRKIQIAQIGIRLVMRPIYYVKHHWVSLMCPLAAKCDVWHTKCGLDKSEAWVSVLVQCNM